MTGVDEKRAMRDRKKIKPKSRLVETEIVMRVQRKPAPRKKAAPSKKAAPKKKAAPRRKPASNKKKAAPRKVFDARSIFLGLNAKDFAKGSGTKAALVKQAKEISAAIAKSK